MRRSSLRLLALTSCAFFVHTAAFAQVAAEGAAQGVEDIVVTAQRREEPLQKSSVIINVATAKSLAEAGVSSTADLSRVVAGVQIGTAGPSPQIYIRGVGDYGSTSITNPAVALNVAGAYAARPHSVAGTFFDLDRVEVLKGPQGTLYGRNASGGAVNILPTKPKLGENGGIVNLSVGNYKQISADGAINLAAGDNLAFRASYQLVHRDGYLSDGSGDDIHQAARLQALWEPSSAVSLLLYSSYFHAGGVGPGFALYDPAGNPLATPVRPATPDFDKWTSVTDPRGAALLAQGPIPPFLKKPGNGSALYQNNEFWTVQAELNADLGFAKLTVIPSYQRARLDYLMYPALSYQSRGGDGKGDPERSESFSGEVRLSRNSNLLHWVVGAYYYHESQDQNSTVDNGLVQNTTITGNIDTESVAVFGQATVNVSSRLRAIGGIRYTNDRRTLSNAENINNNAPGAPPRTFGGRTEASKVDYKAGAEYDLTPDNMLFTTAATGFKAGGVQLGQAAPFRPEKLYAYEVGLRNRFFDNRLQVNLEAFYWDYRNHQELLIGFDDVGQAAALIRNAGKARSYGFNVEAVVAPTRKDRLSFNLEMVNSKYTKFQYEQPLALLPPGQTGCAVSNTGVMGPAGPIAAVDCSGFALTRAPKWTGGARYAHTFDLSDGATLELAGDVQFASSRWLSIDFIPNTLAPAYQRFNASVTYQTPDGKLLVSAFVRNITNEAVYTAANQSTFAPSYVGASIDPPRTYGIRTSVRF